MAPAHKIRTREVHVYKQNSLMLLPPSAGAPLLSAVLAYCFPLATACVPQEVCAPLAILLQCMSAKGMVSVQAQGGECGSSMIFTFT